MKIQLIAIGTKMPSWIQVGFSEYQNRLNKDVQLSITEIPLNKRGKNVDVSRLIEKEGDLMLAAIPKGNTVVTLDLPGVNWTTEQLAQTMDSWQQRGTNISLLIGGPEGLALKCKQLATQSWCLSNLTLPHPLVRVVVAESLYRAWSILNNHPYHRV